MLLAVNLENLNSRLTNKIAQKQSRGSLAWLWRQTHDLESNLQPWVPRSRGLDSRPRHHKKLRDNMSILS
jgi:hypothetical protein